MLSCDKSLDLLRHKFELGIITVGLPSSNGDICYFPNSKGHGANTGTIWGRQDPGGPHVGPTNFTIWVIL